MSSDAARNDPAIAAQDLGKVYHIYDRPQDRLRQAMWRWRRKQYYREFWALRHIDFQVQRGETLGVIGRNGSGKSTLLQIISGTLAPNEGAVQLNGRVSALLELGAGFNPEYTGRENVYLAATMLGLTHRRIDEIYDQIVDFADIGDFVNQPVKTYSSGMYVRLAFAVAISVKPEILAVDEALSVGDIFFQQKCIRHMRDELAGATKLLVTHDMHAITTLTDRVLVLDKGQAVFLGSPLEAVEHYTKSVHNDAFQSKHKREAVPLTPPSGAEDQRLAALPWVEVADDERSGAREVQIERVLVTDADDVPLTTVRADDRVIVRMHVVASMAKNRLIFGYLVNDRMGNAIFGENTWSLADGLITLPAAGRYRVTLEFKWPEIRPGEYTLTFGVGEGDDPLNHTIQCWAHNVVALSAISPNKVIHCLFNNPLSHVEATAIA